MHASNGSVSARKTGENRQNLALTFCSGDYYGLKITNSNKTASMTSSSQSLLSLAAITDGCEKQHQLPGNKSKPVMPADSITKPGCRQASKDGTRGTLNCNDPLKHLSRRRGTQVDEAGCRKAEPGHQNKPVQQLLLLLVIEACAAYYVRM